MSAVLDVAEEEHRSKVVPLSPQRSIRKIPLFTSPSAAGYVSPILGEEYEMIDVDTADHAQFAVRISGDSDWNPISMTVPSFMWHGNRCKMGISAYFAW